MSFTYRYPRPALTVDCVVFGLDETALQVLLIQRSAPPFTGQWALPGGFVELDETLDAAARRELAEETGLSNLFLEQLYTFGEIHRDPRERTVSVAYYALIKLSDYRVQAASDARDAAWFPTSQLPPLAFDHAYILDVARERLRNKVRYQPIGFELLPNRFTLRHLQKRCWNARWTNAISAARFWAWGCCGNWIRSRPVYPTAPHNYSASIAESISDCCAAVSTLNCRSWSLVTAH